MTQAALIPGPRAGRIRPSIAAGAGGVIERYLLRETVKPLSLALIVTLTALLLERVLRLFDMIARGGGSFDAVAEMAVNLVPHYLGQALPAAFFIALFIVISSMDDGGEVDALQATGFSHWRLVRPLVAMGCVFAVFSMGLYGYLQPYSRYGYREVAYMVRNGPWDARVEPGVVVDAGEGVVITADAVDATGRNLTGVLLRRPRPAGEQVISAERGQLRLAPDGQRLVLTVWDGMLHNFRDGAVTQIASFNELTVDRTFSTSIPPFRARGGDEREMTQTELFDALWGGGAAETPDARMASEFHGRIVRAVTLPFLPLLAMTMGVAAKRRRRSVGVVVGAVILVVYQNLVELGESVGDLALAPAGLAVWSPFALFAGFCLWVFMHSHGAPGRNAFAGVFVTLDASMRLTVRAARRLAAAVGWRRARA